VNQFKFPSIKEYYRFTEIRNPDLYIFEKVDGANVSIRKDGSGKIIPGSRGGPIGSKKKYYFDQFRRHVFETLVPEIYELPENLILFGEFTNVGHGHIRYDDENTNKIFLIGIYDCQQDFFLHPDQSNEWISLMGLESKIHSSPLVARGYIKGAKANRLLQNSSLYDGFPEGLVLHQYSEEYLFGVKMTKCYHPDFQEINPRKRGISKFFTTRRFIKAGQKLLINDTAINISSILDKVIEDIITEIGKKEANISEIRQEANNHILRVEDILPYFS